MNNGFTLIEVLVALVLLTIVVSVALESQIITLRVEQAALAAEAVCFEIDRVLAETLCGQTATNTRDGVTFTCGVHRSLVQAEEKSFWSRQGDLKEAGATSAELVRWEIVPRDRPSLQIVMFTHLFQE